MKGAASAASILGMAAYAVGFVLAQTRRIQSYTSAILPIRVDPAPALASDYMSLYRALALRILESGVALSPEAHQFMGDVQAGYIPNTLVIQVRRNREEELIVKAGELTRFFEGLESGNVLPELLTVAHEFGHRLSHVNRTRTDSYEQALDRFNKAHNRYESVADRKIIVREESIAWEHAQTVLKDLGFTDWKDFELQKNAALDQYWNFPVRTV